MGVGVELEASIKWPHVSLPTIHRLSSCSLQHVAEAALSAGALPHCDLDRRDIYTTTGKGRLMRDIYVCMCMYT